MNIGFTGTQAGMTDRQIREVRIIFEAINNNANEPPTLHHGDCIGADEQAHEIAVSLCWITCAHPPNVQSKRAFCNADIVRNTYSYLTRNRHIVEESDILVATPKEMQEILRSGTWDTIRFARSWWKGRKPILIVHPEKPFRGENQE